MTSMLSPTLEEALAMTESSEEEDLQNEDNLDNFAKTMELMEKSRKRKLDTSPSSPDKSFTDDDLSNSPGKLSQPKRKRPRKLSFGEKKDYHGIRYNVERKKFEATLRIFNESGEIDEFVLGYFEKKNWAVRVRDAWIVLHKVRNNKLNMNGKFDHKACAQVQKMNSVLREQMKTDNLRHKTMVSLLHGVMRNERCLREMVIKLRDKIKHVDEKNPLVGWIDNELNKLKTPEKSTQLKPTREMKNVQKFWSIQTDGDLIKLFGKHGTVYDIIAQELRKKYKLPYDAKMIEDRVGRLTKSLKKRKTARRKIPTKRTTTWTPKKDATLLNLVKKFGEDYQFLSTAMGDEFTVKDIRFRLIGLRESTIALVKTPAVKVEPKH